MSRSVGGLRKRVGKEGKRETEKERKTETERVRRSR